MLASLWTGNSILVLMSWYLKENEQWNHHVFDRLFVNVFDLSETYKLELADLVAVEHDEMY